MSQPQTDETTLESAPDEGVGTQEAPAPEPWTPARVLEWNRYYDLYIAAGVLLLVFLAGAHKILNPGVWTTLEAGRLTAQQGMPLTQDPFSFTRFGARWVNIPWLFGLLNAWAYDLGLTFAKDEARQVQVASGILVGIAAAARVLTALVLLGIRRAGPGLWWVAVCATLAFGGMITPDPTHRGFPFAVGIGGIGGPAYVDPSTWGLLLLALELSFLHAALHLGRHRALYALPVLFLLWANIDESFLFGLAILAVAAIGARLRPAAGDPSPPSWANVLGSVAASAAACVVNPNHVHVFGAAAEQYLSLFRPGTGDFILDQLSFFGPESRRVLDRQFQDYMTDAHRIFLLFYLAVVVAVLASFLLNRRRFHLGRFLAFAVAAVLWGALRKLSGEFAVVASVALALNGQEWYQQRFGVEGRLGRGWSAWSIGGRAVTLIAVFGLIVEALTGYVGGSTGAPIGFGVNTNAFAFEAADFLRDAPIQGNVINMSPALGDALIWRAWPKNHGRRTFIDDRKHLFTDSLRRELSDLRRALAKDDPRAWRAILDRYRASAIMLNLEFDTTVYDKLSRNPDWYEFYDDGRVVLFGRADESPDLAYFRAHQLDANALAYKAERNIPSSLQPPTPVTWLDKVFRTRAMTLTQPHALAAARWLRTRWRDTNVPPDPAHCLMAIGELRTALASSPDDPGAYFILYTAYRDLTLAESNILAESPRATGADLLMFRYRQRVTALNYAILTNPPPVGGDERRALGDLHRELAALFRGVNYLDLERDQLELASHLIPADEFPEQEQDRLGQLDEALAQAEEQLDEEAAKGANLLQQADQAVQRGMPGYAISKLESAEEQGVNMATVKWRLIDLYCQTGQPDKTFDLVSEVEDPALFTGPGTPAHRQGLVSFLMGNYENAINLWRDRALQQLAAAEASQALLAARGLVQGEWKTSTAELIRLPTMERDEAAWELELGLCLLEAGKPGEAAEHFTRALTLEPNSTSRPLLAYYLEKIGKPVPPPAEPDSGGATKGATATGSEKGARSPDALPKEVFVRPKD